MGTEYFRGKGQYDWGEVLIGVNLSFFVRILDNSHGSWSGESVSGGSLEKKFWNT